MQLYSLNAFLQCIGMPAVDTTSKHNVVSSIVQHHQGESCPILALEYWDHVKKRAKETMPNDYTPKPVRFILAYTNDNLTNAYIGSWGTSATNVPMQSEPSKIKQPLKGTWRDIIV